MPMVGEYFGLVILVVGLAAVLTALAQVAISSHHDTLAGYDPSEWSCRIKQGSIEWVNVKTALVLSDDEFSQLYKSPIREVGRIEVEG
jgi:hypothetical protein